MAQVLHPPSHNIRTIQRKPRGGILLNSSPSTAYTPLPSLTLSPSSSTPSSALSSSLSSPHPHPQPLSPLSVSSSIDDILATPSASAASSPPPSITGTTHHANSLPASVSTKYASPAPDFSKARSGSAPPNSRRIRFAPLPDPRRAVLITDDGDELPLPVALDSDDDDDIEQPASAPHSRRESDAEAPLPLLHSPDCAAQPNDSLLLGTGAPDPRCSCHPSITTTSPSPTTPTFSPLSASSIPSTSSSPIRKRSASPYQSSHGASSLTSVASTTSTATAHQASLAKKLFRPFLLSKSNHDDPGSLSSLGLFRTSSKESTHSNASTSSNWSSLSRWTSDLGGGSTHRRGSTASSKSAPKARPNSAPSSPRRTTRMLNGRVYGAPRHPNHLKPGPYQHKSKNVFDNVRDESEFVEWGYGGAGSVRNSGAGGKWSKLQSGDKIVVGGYDATERGRQGSRKSEGDSPSKPAQDEDDGSGMAWLKKRREAREKEKKEQEERERQKAAAAQLEPESAPATAEADALAPVPSDVASPEFAEVVTSSPSTVPRPSTPSLADDAAKPSEHVHTAVTIPAPGSKHHHVRTLSSDVAIGLKTPTTLSREPTLEAITVPRISPEPDADADADADADDTSDEKTASEVDMVDVSASSGASTATSETSTNASASDEEDGDEEDEKEEEQHEKHRKTALGAGVEILSRHRDNTAASVA